MFSDITISFISILTLNARHKHQTDHTGVIPGDIEAVPGDEASDVYVVVRHKSKPIGDMVESNGHAEH